VDASAAPRQLSPQIAATIRTLEVDRVTAEVVHALDVSAVACLLLKGPALATWLYGDGSTRAYVDTDLLVAPADRRGAEDVLSGLGFVKRLDDRDTPGWRQAAHHWLRASDRANVDLHRTLVGIGVEEQRLWDALATDAERTRVGGTEVRVPSPPARVLHLALHAAQHGVGGGKHLLDLERGLELIEPQVWTAAAALADRLGAVGSFAAGLRLLPAGSRIADELALPAERSVQTALLAGPPVPGALGWNDLALTRGRMAQVRLAARKLVPTPRFMRAWSPLARRGRVGLAVAYVARPAWVLWHAVPGLLAWRQARTRAHGENDPLVASRP
jgi:hypothetical protein